MTDRRLEHMPLDELCKAKRNPKAHDLDTIQTSVGRFGYVEPVVIDERTGLLVAGHGRRKALQLMKRRGDAPPQGVTVGESGDWLVPVLRGWSSRSDTEAEAYLVASNRLTETGGWHDADLAEMLRDLRVQDALDGVGFSDEELAALCKSVEYNDPGTPENDGEIANENASEHECPACGHRW
jgi:hypothetical protein